MPLEKGLLAKDMKTFIKGVNKMKQEDAEKAITAYCNKMETSIYQAIKSITITIPVGFIKVAGSQSAQVNPAPIVLNNFIT